MTLGIRAKLFILSQVVIATALLVADLALTSALDRSLTRDFQENLMVRVRLVEGKVTTLSTESLGEQDLGARLEALGQRAQARVTLISPEGRVLGDSNLKAEELARVENHGERPEVQQALATGQGVSIRYSTTLAQRMMYAAVPFKKSNEVAGVVRLALPLERLDDTVARLQRILVAASLLALAVAALVSTLAAHRVSRTLRGLAETAQRMVGGQLGERSRTPGSDEIATLGRSLDHLAGNLALTLEQLKGERDVLGAILEGMQEGVLLLDGEGRILHANPAVREMLLLGSELLGKPLLEVVRNADLVEVLWEARDRRTQTQGEAELMGLKPRRLLIHASPLPGTSGKLMAVLVDVTQLRQLETLRRDFVANASHELRTPVASIRSAVETLQGAMEDPQAARSFLGMIERNAKRLQQLVEDLLDLSRIESRELRLQMESVDLGAFAQQVAGAFTRQMEQKSLSLEVDPGAQGVRARADRRALEQVLSNILDNAVKYGQRGGTLRLGATVEGAMVRFSVADDGPGIAAEHLPRLFERFFRVDPGRSRDLGGTGLGLAIVKHLVEAMGGRVRVESEPGKGSTFSFTLGLGD